MIRPNEQNGLIFDIKRFSLHDGPGIRTTVFFKGCPLACLWCQNPESISMKAEILFYQSRCINCGACIVSCPNGKLDKDDCNICGTCAEVCYAEARVIAGKTLSMQELLQIIEKDRVFYSESGGGITFSGGEPMMQIDFLHKVLHYCFENKIHTTIDTSGYSEWENFERVLNLTNLFLFDLKHIDNKIHKQFTGVENTQILSNLKKLAISGADIIVRIPLIGGFNDNAAFFWQTVEFVNSLPGKQKVEILACHNFAEAKYKALKKEMYYLKPAEGKLEEFRGILHSSGIPEGEL